ncbi:MAG: Gfo/Idh/MocA family oxidoreductase [bacterium]|nr:Gfo/Idh/MocA family oxidoreductase [Acidimicrobiia bacterium]MCY4650810.1 Gfo/Idh/MocA family oxidoreductase [bacterium]
MSRRISLGVIGLGSIAQIQHLPNLARLDDLFSVKAVADISPSLNEAIADRLPGEVFTSTDWRDVCSHPDVEAVLLLTSGAHEQLTDGALRAGKHVFSEKPLCLTVEGAERLHTLASKRGLALQVGYMKLHEEVLAELRDALEKVGDLRLFRHTVYHPEDSVCLGPAETIRFDDIDHGIISEAAAFEQKRTVEALGDLPAEWGRLYREVVAASFVHCVSFIRGVVGSLPRLTSADMWRPSPSEPPCILARGVYPDHSRVEMTWLWLPSYPAYRESFEAHGTQGSVQLRFPNPYMRDRTASLTVNTKDTVARHPGGKQSAFVRELRHFHRAITTGEHPDDALGAREDTAWMQDLVAALARGHGLRAAGEAGRRR